MNFIYVTHATRYFKQRRSGNVLKRNTLGGKAFIKCFGKEVLRWVLKDIFLSGLLGGGSYIIQELRPQSCESVVNHGTKLCKKTLRERGITHYFTHYFICGEEKFKTLHLCLRLQATVAYINMTPVNLTCLSLNALWVM